MTTPDFAHSTLGFSTAQHVASGQRMVRPTSVKLDYFGKLPSRGDFVRGAHQPALMQQLDAWVSRAMDSMSQDVRWKVTFDAATPLHFVFLGPHQPVGLAGYVVPSQDASGRRFPFMTTGTTMFNQDDRKKLIWLIKRATSYTAWKRYSDACDAFAKAFEYSMKHAAPEPLLLAPTNGMPDTAGYKYVVDAQINFAKGLTKLAIGDRSGFRLGAELDRAGDLRDRFQRMFGPNPDQVGDYINFNEIDTRFSAFANCDPRGARWPRYKFLKSTPFSPLLALQNFPPHLPAIEEPPQDILIETGEPIPTYGIWEPVKLLSAPKPVDGAAGFSLWHRLTRSAPVGSPVKHELEIIGAPAYLLQGDKAPSVRLDESSPYTSGGSPITWRLLWADDRYLDGTIPAEEAEYFANINTAEACAQPERLRCEASHPCPREGYWHTPAQANSRRHFKAGELMPDLRTDYGATIWEWDAAQ